MTLSYLINCRENDLSAWTWRIWICSSFLIAAILFHEKSQAEEMLTHKGGQNKNSERNKFKVPLNSCKGHFNMLWANYSLCTICNIILIFCLLKFVIHYLNVINPMCLIVTIEVAVVKIHRIHLLTKKIAVCHRKKNSLVALRGSTNFLEPCIPNLLPSCQLFWQSHNFCDIAWSPKLFISNNLFLHGGLTVTAS